MELIIEKTFRVVGNGYQATLHLASELKGRSKLSHSQELEDISALREALQELLTEISAYQLDLEAEKDRIDYIIGALK